MFTTCYTAEMDSAPKNHIETTLKVLFLKNAYCILSRAIYLFWDSTIEDKLSICCAVTAVVLSIVEIFWNISSRKSRMAAKISEDETSRSLYSLTFFDSVLKGCREEE